MPRSFSRGFVAEAPARNVRIVRSPGLNIAAVTLTCLSSVSLNVHLASAQGLGGEQSANAFVWSSPESTATVPEDSITFPVQAAEEPSDAEARAFATAGPLPGELFIVASANARAAIIADSIRLNGSSGGTFLPSAIPVDGQPFADSDARATLQGTGTALRFAGGAVAPNGGVLKLDSTLLVQGLDVDANSTSGVNDASVSLQQAYGQFSGILAGLSETAIADTSSVPETVDLAGPNARVTVYRNGTKEGQGRLSYYLLDPQGAGLGFNLSAEQPVPEIQTPTGTTPGTTFGTFSKVPDFLMATRFGYGSGSGKYYVEDWHLQLGSVVRSLGLENDDESYEESVVGWGVTFSGHCRFFVDESLSVRDGFFFGTTIGEGISHYIVDLRTPDLKQFGNDAVRNADGNLVALPVWGGYASYQHNWTDNWRSSITYSHVDLESINSPSQALSPYRFGDFAGINLVFHREYYDEKGNVSKRFFTGIEYLFGRKQTLDGADGEDNRVLIAVAFSG